MSAVRYHPPVLDIVRRLFGHMVAYGSGEIVLFAVNFLLSPVYTRVLAPAGYGALGLQHPDPR